MSAAVRELLQQVGILPRPWEPFAPPKEVAERLSRYEHERLVRLGDYTAAWRMRWIGYEIGERLAAKHEAANRPQRPVLVPARKAGTA